MKKKTLQAALLLTLLGLTMSAASAITQGATESILQIEGNVNHPLSLTLDELTAMPQTTVNADLYCYSNLVTSGNWTGVQLSLLLEAAEYKAAQSIQFHADDGYTVSISLDTALRSDVIIAYEKDNQPLPETLRLVIPGENGNLWISMINAITVSMDKETTDSGSGLSNIEPSLPTPQSSPTPQLIPSPTPQSTSAPSSSPSPSPTTAPVNSETSTPWTTAALAGVMLGVASASLLLYYFKKRKS